MSSTLRQLQDQITRLKVEKNAAILAHSYQSTDILEIADFTGDSFKLSKDAARLDCDVIILCGVRFMAETAKILAPEKTVILPCPEATCPMAEQIAPERVSAYKAQHPDHAVVAYINTTAHLKAVCDVCVTSSSALQIVRNLPQKDILFVPDQNLGGYIQKQLPDKQITLWDGMCPVHGMVTASDCEAAMQAHPGARMLMHPELPAEVLAYADYIGSTTGIIDYAMTHDVDCIIGTEKSICDTLKQHRPERTYTLLSKKLMCPDMRITSVMDVYNALCGRGGEKIELDESLRLAAKKPIDEMIRLGE